MTYDLRTLAGRIAHAIEKHGGKDADIAAAIGVSRPQISMWRAGTRGLHVANLQALAKVCGVSAAWLLEGDAHAFRDDQDRDLAALIRSIPEDKREAAEMVLRAIKSAA
jgi:transcriptional regulator with XRE-family HTH domain